MKYCPACRSQYSDDTLLFCLQDGATLHADEVKQSGIDTVSFSNPVTADKILKTEELNLYSPKKESDKTRVWRPEPPKSALRPEAAKSKSSAKIWLAAFPVLLAIVAAGLGGWVYLQGQNKEAVRFADPTDASTPETTQKTPPADNSTPQTVLDDLSAPANSNSQNSPGAEEVKKEIAAVI